MKISVTLSMTGLRVVTLLYAAVGLPNQPNPPRALLARHYFLALGIPFHDQIIDQSSMKERVVSAVYMHSSIQRSVVCCAMVRTPVPYVSCLITQGVLGESIHKLDDLSDFPY